MLFYNLDRLCRFGAAPPRKPQAESQISTKNVPALKLEDATPITVSNSQTKSAKEVFTVRDIHSKDELTKDEKKTARAHRKRNIKEHFKAKTLMQKEKRRSKGIAQVDRFAINQLGKNAKPDMKVSASGKIKEQYGLSSSKFFSKMQNIA